MEVAGELLDGEEMNV